MISDLFVDVTVESYKLVESSNILVNNAPILDAVLTGTGLNQISSIAPHFVYTIRVKIRSPDVKEWVVRKRFSELAKLDRKMSEMTRALAPFPPRGARRDLSDDCATRRLHALNHYFSVICKMPHIVNTLAFMDFFDFNALHRDMVLPRCVAEIYPVRTGQTRALKDSELCISSISILDETLMTTLSSRPSLSTKVTRYIASLLSRSSAGFAEQSQIVLWRRLPNSYLFEKSLHVTNINARITGSVILPLDQPAVVFGSSDGLVGFASQSPTDSPSVSFINTGTNPGCAVSAVCCDTTLPAAIAVWVAWTDGSLKLFALEQNSVWKSEYRVPEIWPNEQVYITSMVSSGPTLFCGLSNGVVSVLTRSSEEYRQVTILQGPPTFITSLSLSDDILYATHSCGLMDAVEGSNSVQPWKIAQILSRGTEKLETWGPVTTSCVSGTAMDTPRFAVASARGIVYIVHGNKCEYMFDVEPISALERGCLARLPDEENVVLVACENIVKVFQLPTSGEINRYVDISFLDVCQSNQIVHEDKRVLEEGIETRIESDDEDLRSWARDL